MELLKRYRVLTEQVRLLERQREAGLSQAGEDLETLLAIRTQEREELTDRFEEVLDRADTALQRLIVQQYYGFAVSDGAIAQSLACTAKAVNSVRNRFRRRVEG